MKKYRLEVYVFFLILLLVAFNIIWLKIDIRPPHWDFAIHLINTLSYLDFLRNIDFKNLLFGYFYYPPFVYYLTSFTFLIFAIHEDIAVLSLTPFLIILIYFTFKLGKLFYGKKTGLLSVVGLIGMSFLMSLTREYLLDFPLTAMVVMNAYFFFRSRFFTDKKYSLLFAIGSGLGMLTKWTYVIFLAGAIFLFILDFIRSRHAEKLVNFALMLIILFYIAGPWYMGNLTNIKNDLVGNVEIAITEGDPPINTSASIFYYANSLYLDHLRFPYLILFLIGTIFFVLNLSKDRRLALIFFFILLQIFFMTFYKNKDPRFIVPITPFLAIITSFWIFKIRDKIIRYMTIILLLLIAAFNYSTSAFGLRQIPDVLEYQVLKFPILVYKQRGHTLTPASRENWHVKDIVQTIENDINSDNIGDKDKNILLVLQSDKMFFNMNNFEFYIKLYLQNRVNIKTIFLKNLRNENISLKPPEYIIINPVTVSLMYSYFNLLKEYKKIREYDLPDRSKVVLLSK